MKRSTVFLFLIPVLLSGCAGKALQGTKAVTQAGISSFSEEPVTVAKDQRVVGKNIRLDLGKEYREIEVKADFVCKAQDGSLYTMAEPKRFTIRASGVRGAEMQAAAAKAVADVQAQLTALGKAITPAARDAIITALKAAFGMP